MNLVHGRSEKAARDAAGLLAHGGNLAAFRNHASERWSLMGAPALCRAALTNTLASVVNLLAAEPGLKHAALQLCAEIGRELVAEMQMLRRSRSIQLSGSKTTKSASAPAVSVPLRPGEAGQARGRSGHPFAELFDFRCRAGPCGPEDGQGQAEAGDSTPGKIPAALFAALHCRRAGGVVGGHHVDYAVVERGPQRFAIGGIANGRRTFVFCCAVGDLFSGEP